MVVRQQKILFNQQTPSEVQQNIELFKYVSKAHIDKIEQFRATLAELAVVTQKRNQALLELTDVIQQQQQQQTALKQQQQAKKTTLTKLKTLISSESQRLKVLQQSLTDFLCEDVQDKGDNTSSLFALVIADLHVPEINGLDMVDQARKYFADYDLKDKFPKVIMLTGNEDVRLRDHCLGNKKVDHFL